MGCKRCGRETELTTEFYFPSQLKTNGSRAWCKSCLTSYNRENRDKHRARDRAYSAQYWRENKEELTRKQQNRMAERYAKIAEIKEASPCKDCGNKFPAICMDFDHLDGSAKVADVSKMVNDKRPWAEVFAEIAKCDLVCANCHRIRTQKRTEARRAS